MKCVEVYLGESHNIAPIWPGGAAASEASCACRCCSTDLVLQAHACSRAKVGRRAPPGSSVRSVAALTLLRQVRGRWVPARRGAWQAGQRGSQRAMARAIASRMVANLSAKWRSGRERLRVVVQRPSGRGGAPPYEVSSWRRTGAAVRRSSEYRICPGRIRTARTRSNRPLLDGRPAPVAPFALAAATRSPGRCCWRRRYWSSLGRTRWPTRHTTRRSRSPRPS
jgi:hypothetical protein